MLKATDDSGFTLVEMLVSTAVLGVLMLGLAQFYSTFVRAARQSRAYASIDESLTLVMDKMTTSIKSAARVSRNPSQQSYELVGVDGDGKFISSGDTPHQSLSGDPNNLSDRLHFHGLEARRHQEDPSAKNQRKRSGRIYYAFWINGENSPVTINELRNSWGVVMRKRYHTGGGTLPRYPDSTSSSSVSPVLNLNDSSNSLNSVPENAVNNVLGRYIDYLSFQYYDTVTNSWHNEWDTIDASEFPADERFPSAIRIAIRGYDYRADRDGTSEESTVPPRWHQTTVSLSGSR